MNLEMGCLQGGAAKHSHSLKSTEDEGVRVELCVDFRMQQLLSGAVSFACRGVDDPPAVSR